MTESTSAWTASAKKPKPSTLIPRFATFEHGILPIPQLIFTGGMRYFLQLKDTLLASSFGDGVNSEILAKVLQIPIEHARVVIQIICAILDDDSDPLLDSGGVYQIDEIYVNVFDMLIFLYVQSYDKPLPRDRKDPEAPVDDERSILALDEPISALSSFIRFYHTGIGKYVPSPLDEDIHQLCYLHKHIENILSLLAESVDGLFEGAMILSRDRFHHLGFLVNFMIEGSVITLRQNNPFFWNSVIGVPAIPVLSSLVLEWFRKEIFSAMAEIVHNIPSRKSAPSLSDPSLQEKAILTEMSTQSAKVLNCHDTVAYVVSAMRYATVCWCSDATVVLGAVGKAVRVEHCERIHLITAARSICISKCSECLFYLGVNQKPVILGDNKKLQVAPYNTFYPQLNEHLIQVRINPSINRWDEPVVNGVVDQHDPPAVSDIQAAAVTRLNPDQFADFLIPKVEFGENGSTQCNPFPLPDAYLNSNKRNARSLLQVKHVLRKSQLEDSQKRELKAVLHGHFKDWLYVQAIDETWNWLSTKRMIEITDKSTIVKAWFVHRKRYVLCTAQGHTQCTLENRVCTLFSLVKHTVILGSPMLTPSSDTMGMEMAESSSMLEDYEETRNLKH